jgi:hypothetical protein
MSNEEKDSMLDRAISEIRGEAVDPAAETAAAERVWKRISGAGAVGACAEFHELIPAWREGRLESAQALLVEDHVHGCAACRKTMEPRKAVSVMPMRTAAHPMWKWAVAATLLVGAGFSGYYAWDRLATPSGPRATVYALDGTLLRTGGGMETPAAVGAALEEGQAVRTAKGSHAVVRLRDGSLVEMRERTQLAVSAARDGLTVQLAGGAVIVEAAKQRSGHLYVAAPDCLVSVTGTVFAVNSGPKGSRVSVAEGQVKVEQGGQTRTLLPGQQATTGATVSATPVASEFSWSAGFNKHLALLNEFAKIQKKLEAAPGPGLRYSSKLLGLVPDGTVFYAAIPNLGPTLTEANRLLHEQMTGSETLREWWAEKMKAAGGEAKLDAALTKVRAFSDYLGQEVVIAVGGGEKPMPVLMAEVVRPGLAEFIGQQPTEGHVRVVTDPAQAAAAGEHELLVWVGPSVVVASPDAAALRQAAAGSGAFAKSAFGARIAAAYGQGVSWLFGADLESAIRQKPGKDDSEALARSGFGDLRYLIVERKDVAGRTENQATLSFNQARRGLASWLAAPAPLRSLDYISPDATLAAAALAKTPSKMLADVETMAQEKFGKGLAEFTAETGVDIENDLAALLGGELAFAIDGPALPTPSWKVVVEVNDATHFVDTVKKLVAAAAAKSGKKVALEQAVVNGRTFYAVTTESLPVAVHFTFDNGFLIAAPTRDLVTRAIQNRTTGYTLAKSQKFTALLPHDGQVAFSGAVYHALGGVLGTVAATMNLTPEQQQMASSVEPALVLLYGESDRIEVASAGSFFGLRLDQILALHANHGEHHGAKMRFDKRSHGETTAH